MQLLNEQLSCSLSYLFFTLVVDSQFNVNAVKLKLSILIKFKINTVRSQSEEKS